MGKFEVVKHNSISLKSQIKSVPVDNPRVMVGKFMLPIFCVC